MGVVTEQRAVATVAATAPPVDPASARPRPLVARRGRGDRIFFGGSFLAGMTVLAIMVAVGLFLTTEALQAIHKAGLSFFTTAKWQPDRGQFGIAEVLTGTVLIAFVAVAIALPLSLGTALFITEVAPARLRPSLIAMVDLMAAVPSVVFGLWGLFFFQSRALSLSRWLATWFGWIPFFKVGGVDPSNPLTSATAFTASTFIAGVVVALMVMPIQCSVMREVFSQVPMGEREGAFALGATRWGMIRIVSLPFARGGIIGGTMLGLGRALGETVAVLMIISPRFDLNVHIIETGGNSISSLIANRYTEASGFELSALMAAGLALFAMTLAVNFTASIFVARSRSGAMSEA